MQAAISGGREKCLPCAAFVHHENQQDKIRDVIGKGGATIRQLTEETGTTIDIQEDGTITIASNDAEKAAEAQRRITELTAEIEVGKVYEGTVLSFGFRCDHPNSQGKDGLLHISQIAHERVNQVSDYLKEGQASDRQGDRNR